MKNKILIAEDEKELARAIGTILEYSDYDVSIVYNGYEAIQKTKQDSFNVIILDVMMPVMSGIEALKNMRSNGINTPILLLTAKSQINDKVEGLDAGANDYLTKPFAKDELLARLRALIRENEYKKLKYEVGNIVFNKENSEISNDKATLQLTNKECEIMEILVKNQERNISKNEIIKRVWQSDKDCDTAVNMYISYLQDKFNILGANIMINDRNGYILEKKL